MTPERVLEESEATARLRELPLWRFREGRIEREYTTPGWPQTLMLLSAIGYRAEAAFHHPELIVNWNRLAVRLWTHSAGGVTEKDLALAHQIERVATWRPGEGDALEGIGEPWIR